MARAILLTVLVCLLVAPTAGADRIEDQQMSARVVICKVFKNYCAEALRVSWCESKHYVWAANGQYRGLFQMGSWERARTGTARAPGRSLGRHGATSSPRGKDWSPWACSWAAG